MDLSVILGLVLCELWMQTAAQSNCESILVEGTSNNHGASGVYQNDGNVCNDRPVFQQINGNSYMHYYSSADVSAWVVGSVICSDQGYVFVSTNVIHPADVTETWRETNDETGSVVWEDNPSLKVSCESAVYKGCQEVELSGTNHQRQLEGTYSVMSNQYICYGKFSYQRSSYEYLYNYDGYWLVGPVLCDDVHHMKVYDNALYPFYITNPWKEWTGSLTYVVNPNVGVQCVQSPPPTVKTTPVSGYGLKTGPSWALSVFVVAAMILFA